VEIEIAGRGIDVDGEIRDQVEKRFERVGAQVSDLARLEIVLREETNPSIEDRCVAEATLRLKRATLHAEESAPRMSMAIKLVSKDIGRQVKRHRELRRKRSQTRRLVGRLRGREA
jgi:putative sigma-54 modulation protein